MFAPLHRVSVVFINAVKASTDSLCRSLLNNRFLILVVLIYTNVSIYGLHGSEPQSHFPVFYIAGLVWGLKLSYSEANFENESHITVGMYLFLACFHLI